MTIETERKWLLNKNKATDPEFWTWVFSQATAYYYINQSYITNGGPVTVRVRHTYGRILDPLVAKLSFNEVKDDNIETRIDKYVTCIKAPNYKGGNIEIEQEIPLEEGRQLINMCSNHIHKTRYVVPSTFKSAKDANPDAEFLNWEIDVFHNRLAGLVLIEMEFPSDDTSIPTNPSFLGTEVTDSVEFTNAAMAHITPEWKHL